jgi:membrane protein DedA with SNARE-associated domain
MLSDDSSKPLNNVNDNFIFSLHGAFLWPFKFFLMPWLFGNNKIRCHKNDGKRIKNLLVMITSHHGII